VPGVGAVRRLGRLLPWAVPLAGVIVWQLAGGQDAARPGALPTPWLVSRAGLALVRNGELLQHGWISLQRAGLGLLIGGGLGLLLGLGSGTFVLAEQLFDTPVQMVRNVPHLALIPLAILWFGLGESSKVFLVALGVLFPMYANTFHGVRSVDPQLIEMGRLFGLGRAALFRHVIVPGALPSVLVGLRYALGIMWLSLIVAETIGADAGIGYLAMNAREFMRTDVVIFSIVLYALLGKGADLAVRALERVALRWNPRFLGADLRPGSVAS
jgi:sulfonate transport system permease protein